MKSLEDRLLGIENNNFKKEFISALSKRNYSRAATTKQPYLKLDLVSAIGNAISRYSPIEKNYSENLYNKINKEELKRVYYGILAMGQPNPAIKEIVSKLSDWEKTYFFAGIWKNRGMKGINSHNVSNIIKSYIKSGINYIHERHMVKKAEGKYKRTLKLPESQNFRKKNTQYQSIGLRFKQLLENEKNRGDDEKERTSIFLDGLKDDELKYLTNNFGKKILGGYSIE